VVIESLVTGTLQDRVPDHHRAGALGLADAVMVGSCLVGSLVAPTLVTATGPRVSLLVLAGLAVVPLLSRMLLTADADRPGQADPVRASRPPRARRSAPAASTP
jgi:hypothetical protein